MLELFQERTSGCISDLSFDRWRAHELDASQIEELTRHLGECENCRARHRSLEAQADAFLERFQAPAFVAGSGLWPRVPMDHRRKLSRVRTWSTAVAALAVAATAVLVMQYPKLSGQADSVRSKGSPHLGFYVKHGTRVDLGTDGQTVHAGDQLRFFVSLNQPLHFALLSRDGVGGVTEYYPGTGHSQRVSAAQNKNLDSSIELDGILGREELWAIFCDAPFETEAFRRELAAQRVLQAPANCAVDRISIVKRPDSP